jgi:hypothetical protein
VSPPGAAIPHAPAPREADSASGDEDRKEPDAVVVAADDRLERRMSLRELGESDIPVHVVGEQRARPTQVSKRRLPLEEEVARRVEAVVEEDVDMPELVE